MSFGYSVGDIIKVLELANELRARFVDSPQQFKAILNEVTGLSNVLRDIEGALCQHELTDWQEKALLPVLEELHNVLIRLGKIVDENCCLKATNAESFRDKSRRVWKRLNWEPKEIQDLRLRITLNVGLLNAFNGSITSKLTIATKAGIDRLNRYQDYREEEAILDWLTPTDYTPQQSDFTSRRQEGTGQWLLDSNEFLGWLDQNGQTMFCPGIPGAGKTIFASVVIDHLCNLYHSDHTIGIAYIYFNFRRQHEQELEDLLSSLLKQLFRNQASTSESMKTLYDRHSRKKTRPTIDEIATELHSAASKYSRIYIIIDALDEYQVSSRSRKRFLSELSKLRHQTGANLFVTSRYIPEIEKEFKGSVSVEIRASSDDVRRYLESHMSQLPSFVSHKRDLQEAIITEITQAADGMFLLARLHLDSLVGKRSPKAIRTALKSLQRESKITGDNMKALETAYEHTMERVEKQIGDQPVTAKQALSWITCARRPLTTSELRHALGVEIGTSRFDEENLPELQDIVSICAGLVTVDKESDVIRLVHYTTQEYFERTWTSWFPNAHMHIANVCVTYLSFDAFETGFSQSDRELEARLQMNVLYDYAARNWGHHARTTSIEEDLILNLLESRAKVSATSQAMMAPKSYSGYSQGVPRQVTGVHVAAYFGLVETIMGLLEKGYDPDLQDSYGRAPLSWAAEKGHEAVVKLLLATKKVNVDSKDRRGQTPLSWAARNGHKAVVKLLLATEKVDLDSGDSEWGQTSLSLAAEKGHEAVVELLLATEKVQLDSRDFGYGWTPLSLAAENGHEAVVKLLLATEKVDVDSEDFVCGRTPLSLAAEKGHEVVVKLLLATEKVDVDSKDSQWGRTPLSWAAENGHEAVVKLLLATEKVNPDSKDFEWGRTPLSRAAENGHEVMVKLLLATEKVDVDSKDYDGRTPLSRAAENGHEVMVKLLLATEKVDVDSGDRRGRTLLSWAAGKGHEAVVKLLLATEKVDLNSKDSEWGRTPLSWAARNGHKAVVMLLQGLTL